jgi:hypothetical protein
MQESLFTKLFWTDAIERAIKTFAQTLASLLVGDGVGLLSVDWVGCISVSGLAALVSLLTSVGSAAKAGTDTASLVVDTKELK